MEIQPTNLKTEKEGATYEVPLFEVTNEGLQEKDRVLLRFVKGNKEDVTAYRQIGFMTETLLEACILYLQDVSKGHLVDEDTQQAIALIKAGQLKLQERALKRKQRGVQGTYQK